MSQIQYKTFSLDTETCIPSRRFFWRRKRKTLTIESFRVFRVQQLIRYRAACVPGCMCVCVYVCMHVRMYVCTYVRMCVCMYVRTYVYACMFVMYVCVHVSMYVRVRMCVYMCIYIYVCTYVCMWTYACMHICRYKSVCMGELSTWNHKRYTELFKYNKCCLKTYRRRCLKGSTHGSSNTPLSERLLTHTHTSSGLCS
jgi:hypothetical protein